MSVKAIISEKVAKFIKKAAESASSSVSICGYHQPVEPKIVKKTKK